MKNYPAGKEIKFRILKIFSFRQFQQQHISAWDIMSLFALKAKFNQTEQDFSKRQNLFAHIYLPYLATFNPCMLICIYSMC